LIRWNHPELGMVAPGRFISVAEDSGLIVPIGEWVLREACRQAVAWHKAGLPELLIAVNLSAVQFKRGDVEKSVTQALELSGLNPALLELELTESILIKDTEKVLATVRQLKSLGVKLSIDDFGTGYSSLSYLKRFNVDKLKIDQSFVRDMADDPNDAAIVSAIIQMAKSLNLVTIAEGVEDERQLAQLRLQHCDEAQGYLIARPMPADEFASYMAMNHTATIK
jgi:EAL domain-containing protein (putative c-di-GMP-specific phosphodiesterase class I)